MKFGIIPTLELREKIKVGFRFCKHDPMAVPATIPGLAMNQFVLDPRYAVSGQIENPYADH